MDREALSIKDGPTTRRHKVYTVVQINEVDDDSRVVAANMKTHGTRSHCRNFKIHRNQP